MNRHATLDELASLGADNLRPRKAARISRHVATCTKCAELNDQLSSVPALLSSVPFPPMPASLSVRIDSVLAAEAAQRVAAEPVTEAARRDLPVRAGRRRPAPRLDWHRPGRPAWTLSVPATRVVATAAAIVLVALGGYEVASHTSGAPFSSSSTAESGSALPTPFSPQVSFGGSVTYRQNGSTAAIQMGNSSTNFQAATLAHQAQVAVTAAKADDVHSHAVKSNSSYSNSNLATPTSSLAISSAKGALSGPGTVSPGSQLAGCMERVITPGQVVLLVERAKFENKPATILVTAPAALSGTNPPKEAQIWALGSACSATNADVLDHVKVARL
jgi:hypothetical protein